MSGNDNQINKLLKKAKEVGQYGIFPVSSLSYHPVVVVRENISHKLGLDFSRLGDKTIDNFEINGIILYADELVLDLGGSSKNYLEANFTFYRQGDLYRGVLDIRGIHNPDFLEINVSLIPTVALSPFGHKIDNYLLQKAGNVTFYTLDENGSKWSINCEGKKD